MVRCFRMKICYSGKSNDGKEFYVECRSNVIPECQGWPMEGEWMRGLLLKVTRRGATSKPGQYNISNTVLQHYTTLLLNREIEYPHMCWRAIFPILAKVVSGSHSLKCLT